MEIIKSELENSYSKISTQLYTRAAIIKLIAFIILFSLAFWYIRLNNLLPEYKLESDLRSIPLLFGAGNMIFSILSAFIISTQWSKWDKLVDASRGELNMLRQLFILAHHFPKTEMNELRYHIYVYLKTIIDVTENGDPKNFMTRSKEIDRALVKIEDTMFDLSKKYKEIGPLAFSYLTRAMEYREQKLQYVDQRLPVSIRIFVIFATFSVIFGSLFVPFNNINYNYYFTMVVALLAFGIYLIIEDFDNPYRPGSFVLTVGIYKNLKDEIKSKLEKRGFNVEKAESLQIEEDEI